LFSGYRHILATIGGTCLCLLAWSEGHAQVHSTTWGERDTFEVDADALTRTITTDEAKSGQADTAELLEREPAIRLRQRGGLNGPAYISVRGAEPESTRVLLEGVPLHGATRLALDVNMLLPELFGAIDLYRTTSPVSLGQSYPGGVVNLRLNESFDSPLVVNVGLGSWWSRKLSVAYQQRVGDGHVWASLSYRGTKGDFRFYDTNGTDFQRADDDANARRINNDFNQAALFLAREWRTEHQRLRFFLISNGREGGVSGVDVAQAEEARTSHVEQVIAVEGSRPKLFGDVGDAKWSLSLMAQQQAFRDPESEIGLGRQNRTDQILMPHGTFSTSFWLPNNVSLHLTTEAGIEYYNPDQEEEDPLVSWAHRSTLLGGAELRWRTDNDVLELSAAIRGLLQWQTNKSTDVPQAPERSLFDTYLNPQGGIVVRPVQRDSHKLTLFTYASRSHRQPGFFELYGDNGASVGNPELNDESQTAVEAGGTYEFDTDRISLELQASYWKHWKQDAIVFLALPQGVRKPFNVNGARLQGVDAFVGLESEWVRSSLAFSWLDTESRSADPAVRGNPLPWRSPYSVESSLSLHYADFFVGWEAHFDSEFYTDDRALRKSPARIEHDLSAGWNSPIEAAPSVRLTVRNVGNRRVDDVPFRDGGRDITVPRPVSDYSGYPRPGRSYYATLTWNLLRDR
jgi:hypothetical protein